MAMYRILSTENKMELFRSSKFAQYHRETDLEEWLEHNLHVLTEGDPLLPIGRQLSNPLSGTLDLLALDANGNVVVIELKRRKPPRDAIAQALEYATWAAGQSAEELEAISNHYDPSKTLAERWYEVFSTADYGDDLGESMSLPAHIRLNERQRIFLVVEGYDNRTTAVARYLRKTGLDFNLVTFHYYRIDSGEKMLDFEISVGPDQDRIVVPTGASQASVISEEATIAKWSLPVQAAYQNFRDRLLDWEQDSLRIEPKPAAITFRKQMRDNSKPVYICSFEPDRGKGRSVTIGIRKPSLQDYLDMEAVVDGIENDKPDGAIISNRVKWVSIWFDPTPEAAAQVAGLIHRHLLSPLANQ